MTGESSWPASVEGSRANAPATTPMQPGAVHSHRKGSAIDHSVAG